MTKTIHQSVRFAATPAQLFEMYMDSKKHSESTGGKARISRRVGGSFTAWGGALRGKNLAIIPNKMIVQTWRSMHFKPGDPDSILVLEFSKAPGGAQVDLVHVNVSAQDHKGVTKGWPIYYWKPWKKYIAAKAKRR
jgi:uncharacterized protein YndB with AHSA1/START domain